MLIINWMYYTIFALHKNLQEGGGVINFCLLHLRARCILRRAVRFQQSRLISGIRLSLMIMAFGSEYTHCIYDIILYVPTACANHVNTYTHWHVRFWTPMFPVYIGIVDVLYIIASKLIINYTHSSRVYISRFFSRRERGRGFSITYVNN